MEETGDHYFHILEQAVLTGDAESIEAHLAEAFELGRRLVEREVPPDEVTLIHHEALVRLAQAHPGLSFAQVAARLTWPFMEMSMAYGMAFREQTDRRYQALVNARLAQSHKLEAVGTLAAGIAHDFNNLLGSIIGFAEMAGDELPDGSSGKNNILQILTASFRACDLVYRMLAFARQGTAKSEPVPVEIVAQAREAVSLLNVSYKPDLEICLHAGIERATIMADPGQFHQIVMNLCINAADAMSRRGEIGVLIDYAAPEDAVSGKGKPAICLSVVDRGHGMMPEVQERIFDPFFSTKGPSKGSGLGLSVVHGIVTQLGGSIEVKSRAAGRQRGTEFKVFLPVVEAPGPVEEAR
jgi:signal transduction histidine kinase